MVVAVAAALIAGGAAATVLSGGDGGGLAVDRRTAPDGGPDDLARAPADPTPLDIVATPAGGVWLTRESAPLPVPADHRAVWASDGLVAWGSEGQVAVYDIRTRRWGSYGRAPLGPLLGPALVWTGSETVVWGGQRSDGTWSVEGAAIDHRLGSWRALPDAPVAIRDPVVVWTGQRLLAWGAEAPEPGASQPPHERRVVALELDVAGGAWSSFDTGPVGAIERASGVWTGTELVVWGRDGEHQPFAAAYAPGEGWRALADPPLDQPARAAVTWAGEHGRGEVVLWGRPLAGQRSTAPPAGAALDPRTGRWRLLPPAPGYDWTGSRRGVQGLRATWTGERVLVVGGYPRSVALAYDPAADTWAPLPDLAGVVNPVLTWTGPFVSSTGIRRPGELLLWGGYGPYGPTVTLRSWRTVGLGPTSDARLNTGP